MDFSNDKINSIISNPESLKMIASIAENLMQGNRSSPKENEKPSTAPSDDTESSTAFSHNSLQTENIPHNHNYDNRISLLNSLKPFVSNDKQYRIDSLVKALHAARVIENYKNSNDFTKR